MNGAKAVAKLLCAIWKYKLNNEKVLILWFHSKRIGKATFQNLEENSGENKFGSISVGLTMFSQHIYQLNPYRRRRLRRSTFLYKRSLDLLPCVKWLSELRETESGQDRNAGWGGNNAYPYLIAFGLPLLSLLRL